MRHIKASELEVLPSMDNPSWYDPPRSPSSSSSSSVEFNEPEPHFSSNSTHKLDPEAQWFRSGKMCAWGPSFEEAMRKQRAHKRLELCLEQMLPESAAEIGVQPPQNIIDAEEKRRVRKRRRSEDKEWRLPHLQSPSPPLSTLDLAPMLALPSNYIDIVSSPAMRYSLGDDSMERGLQKTATDLLEGEKGLMQALGRLREVLRVRERDVPEGTDETTLRAPANGNHVANGDATANGDASANPEEIIPALPQVSETDNLWRITQDILSSSQPPPTIEYTATPEGAAEPSMNPPVQLTPIHRLFTCPAGMTLNAVPDPFHPGFQQLNPGHAMYPTQVKYNLDLSTQQKATDDAIERIMELLADCNEYKERLEEARERVADVARARKMVWKVIRRRAGRELDRIEGKA
jgi:hypothetical protein